MGARKRHADARGAGKNRLNMSILPKLQKIRSSEDMNDLAWDVFYDETNNYRKVFLSNGRLNITFDSNFVLAGIATKESKDSIVWNNFYKKDRYS